MPITCRGTTDMTILSASIVALAVFTAAPAWAICTPATVNPEAVQRIAPRMAQSTVLAVMGCPPAQHTTGESGMTLMRFTLPLTPGGVLVVFDSRGAIFVEYIDPTVTSYVGAVAPYWIPSAGVLPPW